MIRSITLILLFALIFQSCNYPDIPKEFEYTGKMKVEYPPYLKRTNEIHPRAAFQAQNKYRDVYYIIVPHPWRADSAYADFLFDSLAKDLQQGVLEPFITEEKSYENEKGYNVKELKMNGKLKDKTLGFTLQLIQKDTFLYQSAAWMFKNKQELWQKDIDEANASITILE